jgi:ubiquinone biosynthesis protein COQ9
MLDAFDDWADRQMLARLENEDLERLRLRDRIAAAVRARIEVLAPYREATRRALAARALPNTAMGGFQNLWRTVDRMWLAAGDAKDDGVAVYTKRATLAAIYTATVLYWLEDTSLDQEDTWAFLDRRIDGVMRVQTFRQRANRLSRRLPFRRRPHWSEEAEA